MYEFDAARRAKALPEPFGEDNWQAPLVTAVRGGDCEDKAIYLWWMLKQRDIPSTVVFGYFFRGITRGILHAWVEWEFQGTTYILDPAAGEILHVDSPGATAYETITFAKDPKQTAYTTVKLWEFEERTGLRDLNPAYDSLLNAVRSTRR